MPFFPIEGIIFDLDGTLADTLPLCYAAYRHVFERFFGYRPGNEEITRWFGPSEEGIIRAAIPADAEEALDLYLDFYEHRHAELGRPIAGIDALLDWLRIQRLRVGLVTGKGPRSGEISLRQLGLDRRIDAVRYGSPLGGVKPYAIKDLLAEWGLPPERGAYVGDAPSDMYDAACAGCLPAGAAWAPGADPLALRAAGAVYVFAAPSELQRWVAGDQVWLEGDLTPRPPSRVGKGELLREIPRHGLPLPAPGRGPGG